MALTDLLKSFARASAFGLALYACGGEEKAGCQTDYDCREPRVCVEGYCEGAGGDDNYDPDGGAKVGNDGACGNSPFNNRFLIELSTCNKSYFPTFFFDGETCTAAHLGVAPPEPLIRYSGTELEGSRCIFTRDFSCFNLTYKKELCQDYQCAIRENKNIYIHWCGPDNTLFFDNLWMLFDAPIDIATCERTIAEPWFGCFRTEP